MLVKFLKEVAIFLLKLGLLVGGFYLVIAIFFGIVWFIGTNMEEKKESGVKEQVEIILEESEESYVNRVGKLLYTKHDKNYKLTNHKIKFDGREGSILVRVADSSLEFKYPRSLMVTTDWREKVRKVNSFYFTLDLTPQGRIKNREARSRIYEILKELRDVGWKRYISSSSSRISGKEVYAYNKEPNIYDQVSLDDKYILSDEEWMSLTSYDWKFYYKDKAYLDVSVYREQKGREIDLDDGYFITVNVETIAESEKSNFEPHERYRWKELYPALLEKDKGFREETEKQAIEKGYHIDYQYEDSPLNRGIFDLSDKS